jgi:hypothetical protein
MPFSEYTYALNDTVVTSFTAVLASTLVIPTSSEPSSKNTLVFLGSEISTLAILRLFCIFVLFCI